MTMNENDHDTAPAIRKIPRTTGIPDASTDPTAQFDRFKVDHQPESVDPPRTVRERHQFESELSASEDESYNNSPGMTPAQSYDELTDRMTQSFNVMRQEIIQNLRQIQARQVERDQGNNQPEPPPPAEPISRSEPARVATAILGLLLSTGAFALTDIQTDAAYSLAVAIAVFLSSIGAGEWIRSRVSPAR